MSRKVGGNKLSYFSDGNLQGTFKQFFDHALTTYDERRNSLLFKLNEMILARTPVWEGDVIHNWRWSTRAPDFRHEDPIERPDDPGPTGRMALGAEPRRAANAARARQSLMGALRARDPVDIYLTNSSESAVSLEYGLLPTKARSRSPLGMVRLSVKEVMGGYV